MEMQIATWVWILAIMIDGILAYLSDGRRYTLTARELALNGAESFGFVMTLGSWQDGQFLTMGIAVIAFLGSLIVRYWPDLRHLVRR